MFTRAPNETASLWNFAARFLSQGVAGHDPPGGDLGPVQRVLEEKWRWYTGAQYDELRHDWLGAPLSKSGMLTKALVPRSDGIPPGFRTMASPAPRLSERVPCAPGRHVRRVVDRFTVQLFGDGAHPILKVVGDEATQHWLQSLERTSRLWADWGLARAVGGAQGAVAMGFKVRAGRPVNEVLDPRVSRPVWADKEALELAALEQRWRVAASVRLDRGQRETWHYWLRRLINEEGDFWYLPVWCDRHEARTLEDGTVVAGNPDGQEPTWARLVDEQKSARHGLGFCPVVWVQNLPCHDSPYGYADCDGLYAQARDLDELAAGLSTAIKHNADPTLVLTGTEFPRDLRKGTGNGIGLPQGAMANYLEMSGGGISVGMQWYEKRRDEFYAEAECWDQVSAQGAAQKTAFEVGAQLGPQQGKLAALREQYGQRGVRRYLELVLRVARALEARGERIDLEPRVVREQEGEDRTEEVRLGAGGYLELSWPPLAQPSAQEASTAITTAVAGLTGGVLDLRAAVGYAAPYCKVEDVAGLVARLLEEKKRKEEEAAALAEKPPAPPASPAAKPPEPSG